MSKEPGEATPLVVGILGGVASGKSTVAELFQEMGAMVIDADELAREVLETPEGKEALQRAFGDSVLGDRGLVDRTALSKIVFQSEESLKTLNGIIHPAVSERIRSRLGLLEGSDVAVLDVPLLAETTFLGDCDLLVFVDAPIALREERARAVRGWEEGEVARRERHQSPLQEKRARADLIVANVGTIGDVRLEAGRVWKEILELGRGKRGSGSSRGAVARARPGEATAADPGPTKQTNEGTEGG